MRPRDVTGLKPLNIFPVRVGFHAQFPRKPRHRLSEFSLRLVTLALANSAQHGIGRSRHALSSAARLAGSHWPDPLRSPDHEPITPSVRPVNARWLSRV